MLKFSMSRLFFTFVLSFFVMFSPVKSFAGSWIELDSNWFGSDWYYHSDLETMPSKSVRVWISENFDKLQQTKDKNGKIYRYNEIRSQHYVRCYNKTVNTVSVHLWINGSGTGGSGNLDTFPDIDYGEEGPDQPQLGGSTLDDMRTYLKKRKQIDYPKFSGSLKSPLKKLCKIYD